MDVGQLIDVLCVEMDQHMFGSRGL